MFENLKWSDGRAELNGVDFRIETAAASTAGDEDHFKFYKTHDLIDQYRLYFARRPAAPAANIFELGIYDGGSTAFWFESLKPRKHVAIDFQARRDSPYFKRWVASRGLAERVSTYWQNQADRAELLRIVRVEMDGPLDLVIDDASHLYAPSKASFETLFPLLRSGGTYILEDWAWDHWGGFSGSDHPWARERRLTDLVVEIIEAAGTARDLVARVEVFNGFVAIERGPLELTASSGFRLDDHIQRRPARETHETSYRPPSPLGRWARRWWRKIRYGASTSR
jgi:hypothetical protein